jgi:cohesin loading factor subunit SCC2
MRAPATVLENADFIAQSMDRNAWYPQNNMHYQPTPASTHTPLIADTVHESHRLLSMYPMASAMPATHGAYFRVVQSRWLAQTFTPVARHLGNLSIGAAAPSFYQPDLYSQSYPQGNPPPYTEFAHDVGYMPTPQAPPQQNAQYGATTVNHAVTLLGNGPGP